VLPKLCRVVICFAVFLIVILSFSSSVDEEIASLNELAANYFQAGKYENALQIFKRVVKLKPTESVAYFNLGGCFFKLRDYKSSLVCFYIAKRLGLESEELQKAIKILKDKEPCLYSCVFRNCDNCSGALKEEVEFWKVVKAGDKEKASELLDVLLKAGLRYYEPFKYWFMAGEDVGELLNEAVRYYKLGDYDRSLELAQSVLMHDPENEKAKKIISLVKKKREKREQILKELAEVKESYKNGNWRRAVKLGEKLLELDPNGLYVNIKELKKLIADSHFKLGEVDKGVETLLSIPSDDRDKDILLAIAEGAYLSRNYDTALKFLDESFRKGLDRDTYVKMLFKIWFKKWFWFVIVVATFLLVSIFWFLYSILFRADYKEAFYRKRLRKAYEEGKWEEVKRYLLKIKKLKGEWSFEDKRLWVDALMALKDWAECSNFLKTELSNQPQNQYFKIELARVYKNLSVYNQEALELYRFAAALDKEFEEVLLRCLIQLALYSRDLKLKEFDIRVVLANRDRLSQEEKEQLAKLVAMSVDEIPDSLKKDVAKFLIEFADRYEIAKALLKLDVVKDEVLFEILIRFVDREDDELHRKLMELAVKLGKVDSLLLKYEFLRNEGKEWAVKLLEVLKSKSTAELDDSKLLSQALKDLEEGRVEEAIARLKLAEEAGNQVAGHWLVKAYAKKRLYRLAWEKYNQLRLFEKLFNPEIMDITYELARVLEEAGDFKKALKLYNEICKTDIGYRDAFRRFEELYEYVKSMGGVKG